MTKDRRRYRRWLRTLLAASAALLLPLGARASVGLYVGKALTADGSTLLGGYGDEPSSHWIAVVPRATHPAGSMIEVGANEASRFPGVRTKIPQAAETFKFLTVRYSAYAGFPAPLCNGGLNEYGVASRDISCGSRAELRKMTPNPQRGLSYSDLSQIALERARSAREAARIVGELVETYGEATYGGNSHLFADKDEGWVLVEFAGGQGLWVAARLRPDEVRVVRGGCGYRETGEIELPPDFLERPDFMGSRKLFDFAASQGWYERGSGKPLSINRTFLSGNPKPEPETEMEQMLRRSAPRVTVADMMAAVRSPRITRESAGYGSVAHLRAVPHRELALIWLALAPSVASPFLPHYVGMLDVPPEFKMHRYLTEGEAERFIPQDLVPQESTRSAYQVFKRLFYLTCEHYRKFLAEVNEALESFEGRLLANREAVERTALRLFQANEEELARRYLTYYCNTEALGGMRLGEALSVSLEARAKLLFGIAPATGKPDSGIVHCRER
jgi:dipeptidase